MAKYTDSLLSAKLLKKIGAWRTPIFMVDRIIDFKPGKEGYITVIKHVNFNESFIEAHFPGNPVMPGVLIAEIFGQASEYFSLFTDYCQHYEKKYGQALTRFADIKKSLLTAEAQEILIAERYRITGFLAAQDVKFKYMVTPGDTIEVTSQLIFADNLGFHHYNVTAHVGRHLASHGKIINYRQDEKQINNMGMAANN